MPPQSQAPASQDPILNPSLVTDHPSARQDKILQQLSSLKQVGAKQQQTIWWSYLFSIIFQIYVLLCSSYFLLQRQVSFLVGFFSSAKDF